MATKILLTGSSGFIGSYLKFEKDIKSIVTRKNEVDNCKYNYKIDSLNGNTCWRNAFCGIDCIIHLAGLAHSNKFTDSDYYSVNTQGTLKLASDAAKAGVKRFVFVSTIGVNGSSTRPEKSFSYGSKVKPHNAYAKSKLDAELGLKKLAKETGLEIVIVRPTLVYGPNAPGNFGLLTRLVKNLPLLPFGLVKNQRSFIAVQNLVDLLLTCAKHPNAAGYTFLASDCESVSTKQFTNAIAKGLNKSVCQLSIPVSVMYLVAKLLGKQSIAEQLLGNLEVDSSNAFDVMGWVPPYSMEQAMTLLSKEVK
ncbi:NAD-dependent epimerase/dehydratase family protein [Photobacterium leiognathi]|uniref:NAD-dependent epimerase/dehydratase family protein n=1 Tax=Photobacterium leiognathi TaxID=553611 RepID=UPI002733F778|nr:NAD-dependent epimerase/dehydratase family protein [Photobacterium leiognathi]